LPEEKDAIKYALKSIVKKADQLQKAKENEKLKPCVSLEALRPDKPAASIDRKAMLANAPAVKDGCFLVSPIWDTEGGSA
jgi:aspartyl/glutamyl-tRNA(Asn/Gln) amidotransferase C subunit